MQGVSPHFWGHAPTRHQLKTFLRGTWCPLRPEHLGRCDQAPALYLTLHDQRWPVTMTLLEWTLHEGVRLELWTAWQHVSCQSSAGST